jgi:hypothetical protein
VKPLVYLVVEPASGGFVAEIIQSFDGVRLTERRHLEIGGLKELVVLLGNGIGSLEVQALPQSIQDELWRVFHASYQTPPGAA